MICLAFLCIDTVYIAYFYPDSFRPTSLTMLMPLHGYTSEKFEIDFAFHHLGIDEITTIYVLGSF